MNTTSSSHALDRLAQHLTESELFVNYGGAFQRLTGLNLALEAAKPDQNPTDAVTTFSMTGVASTCVPVRVGKTHVATLLTGGVRLSPPNAEDFAPVAKALLDNGHSAAEVRAEKDAFNHLPWMDRARYDDAVALLRSFAFQLGECAHRLVFATAQTDPEPVRLAKLFIQQHLNEAISLETVAHAVGVSSFHFCKVFKRATGMTFTDYLSRARVEKAKKLLMRPSNRITEVAYEVGFQSLSHFNRSFRRVASESPTEFRARMRGASNGALAAA